MKYCSIVISFFILTNFALGAAEEQDLNAYYQIAKHTCQDIPAVRKEIDRINNAILKLITERTAYVQRIGDLKARATGVAHDAQRVKDQEKGLICRSNELKLPLEISIPIFKTIVEVSTEFQQKYINNQILFDVP